MRGPDFLHNPLSGPPQKESGLIRPILTSTYIRIGIRHCGLCGSVHEPPGFRLFSRSIPDSANGGFLPGPLPSQRRRPLGLIRGFLNRSTASEINHDIHSWSGADDMVDAICGGGNSKLPGRIGGEDRNQIDGISHPPCLRTCLWSPCIALGDKTEANDPTGSSHEQPAALPIHTRDHPATRWNYRPTDGAHRPGDLSVLHG